METRLPANLKTPIRMWGPYSME